MIISQTEYVIISKFKYMKILKRLKTLKKNSHVPFDFNHLVQKLDDQERRIKYLERVVRDLGR